MESPGHFLSSDITAMHICLAAFLESANTKNPGSAKVKMKEEMVPLASRLPSLSNSP